MDVIEYMTRYKQALKARGYARSTIRSYTLHLDLFEQYLQQRKITDIRQITRHVVISWHTCLFKTSLAMVTKIARMQMVRRFFEYLLETGRLIINPTDGIKKTRYPRPPIGTVMTRTEVRKILDQPDLSIRLGIRDRAIMEVFYTTGIRVSELIRLTVYDPDLSESVVYIRNGKGSKDRVVPLGKALCHVKTYMQKVRPGYTKQYIETTLFLNRFGRPMRQANIQQMIRQHQKDAGIKTSISPHTFRRTCATHMLQNGADIRYIQQLLGHKKLSTTQLYTKVVPVDLKQTHERTHPACAKASAARPAFSEGQWT